MKLAVSNIAWEAKHDTNILPKLRDAGVKAIEVAPGRLFRDPTNTPLSQALDLAGKYAQVGVPILSMQALLFGQPDLRLIGSQKDQTNLKNYLSKIFKLASALGCGPLVFGSPKNRIKGNLTFEEAGKNVIPALFDIGDLAANSDVVFCLEANAAAYGCDFINRLEQAADVARMVGHKNISVVADTGNMIMEGEEVFAMAAIYEQISHVHISAPELGPIRTHESFISDVLGVLSDRGYGGIVTLEMRVPTTDDPVADLFDNIAALQRLIEQS